MKKSGWVWIGAILLLSVQAGMTENWTVGEKWVYQHEGAIPMSPPDQQVNGDRTREVVSVKGEGDAQRWVFSDVYAGQDDRSVKFYVSKDSLCDQIEGGDGNIFDVKPGIPGGVATFGLKPGEEKTVEAKFELPDGNSAPMKYVIKRMDNETVKVPAGEFANCAHMNMVETFTFGGDGQEMTITTIRDFWHNEKVNGVVKESFTTKLSMPGQSESKGTSSLKAYTKEKAK